MRAETDATERATLVGQVIGGKYEVVAFMDRGATGAVYRALQLSIGREIVLKVLQPSAAVFEGDPNFAERFRREASTHGRLRSPNTVTVFDYGEHIYNNAPLYFMAMEYVEGRTLRQILKEDGRLAPARAVAITVQILKALREAHNLGIVHRDLKPGNVMIVESDDGEIVKVLDFGVAKVLAGEEGEDEALTQTGTLLGTPHYMAPEQIRIATVDGRTDLYALGCIIFEMLSGAAPYRGAGAIDTCAAHLTRPVPGIDEVSGQSLYLPHGLEAVVRRCIAKRPEERYQSADDLLLALRRFRDGGSVSGTFPGVERSRWPLLWVAGALFLSAIPLGLLAAGSLAILVALGPRGAAPLVDGGAPPMGELVAVPVPLESVPAEDVPARLELLSEPAGALVLEGDLQLGITPLVFPEGLPEGVVGPLTFRLGGYESVTVPLAGLGATVRLPREASRKPPPRPAQPEGFRPDLRGAR